MNVNLIEGISEDPLPISICEVEIEIQDCHHCGKLMILYKNELFKKKPAIYQKLQS
jgi:hypothetical protein